MEGRNETIIVDLGVCFNSKPRTHNVKRNEDIPDSVSTEIDDWEETKLGAKILLEKYKDTLWKGVWRARPYF